MTYWRTTSMLNPLSRKEKKMGYSKQTQNYHLPQYVADDRPSYLGDWNEAMGLIDTGMEENKEGLVETNTALANMRTYVDNSIDSLNTSVDNSIDSLNTSVDNKLNTVDEKLANVYTKPESDSRFVRKVNGGIAVVVGDSITLGTGTANPSTDNWTVTLAAKRNMTVHNYAQNNAWQRAVARQAVILCSSCKRRQQTRCMITAM